MALNRKRIVCGIIRDSKGRILLLHRRKDRKNFPDFWHPVSGTIEEGELPDDCLKREIKEEIGISNYRIIKKKKWIDKITEKETEFEAHVYLLETEEKIIIADKTEHDKFLWTVPEDIGKFRVINGLRGSLKLVGLNVS